MDHLIVTVVCVVLLVVLILTFVECGLTSADTLEQTWVQVEAHRESIARTRITDIEETSCDGNDVYLVLRNDGDISLTDFGEWDVIGEYYSAGDDLQTKWYSYDSGASPGANKWGVEGIYLDASGSVDEIHEVGVFNPGEEMQVHINVNPDVASGTTGRVLISTPTGVTSEVLFTR